MVTIRRYAQNDGAQVGVLIADTYGEFNLAGLSREARQSMLGPFAHAHSSRPQHRVAVGRAILAPSVWVAEHEKKIVGVLRGGRIDDKGRTVLSSLFVCRRHHRQGVGRDLVDRFEREYAARGSKLYKVASTLYAVPFYLSVGYLRSTGVRVTSSFGRSGLLYQPMNKKIG
ncbi:MAG: GNAT family N-acetyltransferase [bacterium]|nr:GNAT family N-acetyltransferase [bacterium]